MRPLRTIDGLYQCISVGEMARVRALAERARTRDDVSVDSLVHLVGRKVLLRDKNFDGISGIVIDSKRSRFVVVEVFMFNRLMSVELEIGYVELL